MIRIKLTSVIVASTPDTSLYSEPLELIWNDFPWIVETCCRRRFFTSSDGIDEFDPV